MTSDQSNTDDQREGTKVERDHPQTRKGEDDARGSAKWNEDVERPKSDRKRGEDEHTPTVAELSDEAEEVREQAVGDESARSSFGSDKAAPE